MNKIKLIPYLIKVKKSGLEEFYKLNDIEHIVLLDELYIFLKNYNSSIVNEKIIKIEKLENDHNTISGIISVGEYGFKTDGFDINLKKLIKEWRTENIGELFPFFFMIKIPVDKKTGILILESYKGLGIKSLFREEIIKKVVKSIEEKINKSLTLSLELIISRNLMKKLSSGEVKKLELITYKQSRGKIDKYIENDPVEYSIHEIYIAKKNKKLSLKIKDILQSKEDSYYTIKDKKIDKINIQIQTEDKRRETLKLSNDISIKEYYLVSLKDEDKDGGFPKKEILLQKAEEYINALQIFKE